jgi:SAM-dependent methyltransferase
VTQRVTRGYGLLEPLLARFRARKANALIPSPFRTGSILDIGCGQVPYFLLTTDFRNKVGIERNPSRPAEDGVALIAVDVGRIQLLPFREQSFDVVTMLAVVEHLDPSCLHHLLPEVRRILKPKGCIIVTTPAHWVDPLLTLMSKLRLVSSTEIEEHKRTYSPGLIRDLLVAAGFSKQGIQVGLFEFGMNCWARARTE